MAKIISHNRGMKNRDIRNRLASNLRRMREQLGWSQETLAEHADLHRTYVSGLERGKRNPTIGVLEKIARALGVGVSDLVRGKEGK